jgi:hypothetical protein
MVEFKILMLRPSVVRFQVLTAANMTMTVFSHVVDSQKLSDVSKLLTASIIRKKNTRRKIPDDDHIQTFWELTKNIKRTGRILIEFVLVSFKDPNYSKNKHIKLTYRKIHRVNN